MKTVTLTYDLSGEVVTFPVNGSYSQLRETFQPGKAGIKSAEIEPCCLPFPGLPWIKPEAPNKAYEGELTYLKLLALAQCTDLTKVERSENPHENNRYYGFWLYNAQRFIFSDNPHLDSGIYRKIDPEEYLIYIGYIRHNHLKAGGKPNMSIWESQINHSLKKIKQSIESLLHF